MEVASRTIEIDSRSDKVKLTFIGDIHKGGADCDVKLLRRCVNHIKDDPAHYWFGMGDYGEYINYRDPRFRAEDLPGELPAKKINQMMEIQTRSVISEFRPIGNKCLGLIKGNHEDTLEGKSGVFVYDQICEAVRDGGAWDLRLEYCAIVKLRIKRAGHTSMLRVFLHHGAGGGGKTGASVNRTEDLVVAFPGNDIYVRGHDHKRYATVRVGIGAKDRKDEQCEIHTAFGDTGSFKKTYTQGTTNYAEKKLMNPTSMGVISFILDLNSMTDQFDITAHCSTSGLPA